MYLKFSAFFLAVVTVVGFGYLYRAQSTGYPLSRTFSANAFFALADISDEPLSLSVVINDQTIPPVVAFNDTFTVSWKASDDRAVCIPSGSRVPKALGGYWDQGTLAYSGSLLLIAREGQDVHVQTLTLSLLCQRGSSRTEASVVIPVSPHSDTVVVIGGQSRKQEAYHNTVFVSTDMRTWQSLPADLPKEGRAGHALVYFKNAYWLLGGATKNENGEEVATNDVFMSLDGVTWVKSKNAPWQPRAGQSVAVLGDTLYLFGGSRRNAQTGPIYYSDVWTTKNGINWDKVAETTSLGGRSLHTMTTFQNKLWVYGGVNAKGVLLGDLSYSLDGINWIPVAIPAKLVSRAGASLIGFGNELYLLGGRTEKGFSNDVWRATGGMDWKNVAKAEYQPRAWQQSFVFNNSLVLVGGRDAKQDFADLWMTTDGILWQKASDVSGLGIGSVGVGVAVKKFEFGK